MFNVGPLELIVLAFVGIVVLGPDRLPGIARDAARLIRTLREVATGPAPGCAMNSVPSSPTSTCVPSILAPSSAARC
jgi:hypothetical protein